MYGFISRLSIPLPSLCLSLYKYPGGSVVKDLSANAGDADSVPGVGRSLEKEMATHSSILVGKIPGAEEPAKPQSTGSQHWKQLSN